MQNPELYLKKEEHETWLDAHERELLEDKKFFIGRPFIAKVFHARLQKIKLRREAFVLLDPENGELEMKDSSFKLPEINLEMKSLKEAFSMFNQFKMHWQLLVFQSTSVHGLSRLISEGLDWHQKWLKSLGLSNDLFDESTLLSKAPDPSVLQEALIFFDRAGGKSAQDAFEMEYQEKETLIGELKRLSLQLEKEK